MLCLTRGEPCSHKCPIILFLAAPVGTWDLSSPTSDRTYALQWEQWELRVLTTGSPGKSQDHCLNKPSTSSYCQASIFSLVLSCPNKNLKLRTLEPSACHSSRTDCVIALGSWTDHVIALRSRTDRVIALRSVLQLLVTALFYLENNRKIHPRGVRPCRPKDAK